MTGLNCKISKGVSASCDTSVAGINRLAILNWQGPETYTFTGSSGNCIIDTIDLGESGEKAYSFDIADGTGVATATGTIGGNNSSRYFQHSVGGTIMHLDCDVLEQYQELFLGSFIIFVETKNREVFAFGVDNGLNATTFEYTSGTAESDATGISFVYEGAQKNAPLKIKDWATVKSLMN